MAQFFSAAAVLVRDLVSVSCIFSLTARFMGR
jgi:hypothetical protein